MATFFDGYNDIIRLNKGERLSDALRDFAAQNEIPGAWVSGLGGALEVTLGFYNLQTKEYKWQTFTGLYEITALQGNLAFDESGKIMFHLHGTFGDDQFKVIGGHVKDLVAAATVELFIHRTYKPLHRKTDPAVGLQTLDLNDNA
jgi:predicted DNA-binding protein with PD1-like motif